MEENNLTKYEFTYNNGKGRMSIYLEMFFKRKDNGRFEHTKKENIYKLFKLIADSQKKEKIIVLLKWLRVNKCEDLVKYFLKKFPNIKESDL